MMVYFEGEYLNGERIGKEYYIMIMENQNLKENSEMKKNEMGKGKAKKNYNNDNLSFEGDY